MAERDGEIVGSVFVVDAGDGVAKLRLLYVEPDARGLGLGRRLVEEALRFAARAGYRGSTLWTNDVLVAARRIYEATGFRLVSSEPTAVSARSSSARPGRRTLRSGRRRWRRAAGGRCRKACFGARPGVGAAKPPQPASPFQGAAMARVTVEDCIDKVDNRFDLVLMASHRARAISSGAQIHVARDNDKNPVVALREIADSKLSPDDLREDVIHALQKHVEVDEPEAEAAPPMIHRGARPRRADAGADAQFDRMTEEDLLRGLEGMAPPPEPEEEGE